MSGDTNVVVDGINTVSVTCTSGEANPQPDITWRRNNSPITSSSNIVNQDGQYGGKTSTQVLEFIPTRDDQSVTCRASNTLNTNNPLSDNLILDTKCMLFTVFHHIYYSNLAPVSSFIIYLLGC